MMTKHSEQRTYFRNPWNILGCLLVLAVYAAISVAIMYAVSRSGVWPSGSDTMCHIYKGSVLYQALKNENWYPLFDPMWYNGVEMMRYWAPMPVYFLAMCQAIAGGDCFGGYLVFLGIVFFLGALSWFVIGCRHQRRVLGVIFGVLWFFMPNNLLAVFVEGNLPRALCMVVLPLFVENVHDYLLERRWSSLPKLTVCFVFMTMCHTGYAGMIALAMLIFLAVFGILYRKSGRAAVHVLLAVICGFLLTGIWLYASLQGGITSTDSSQVMRQFFQSAWLSLDPLRRLSQGFDVFYFGLAALILVVFGMLLSRRKSMAGFWTAFIIFLCTTTTMYDVLVLLPGSQYLWMLRFISIALCFALYSLLIWRTLKKPFLVVLMLLLVLDTVPSLRLIYGEQNAVTPDQRLAQLEETTLIGEAKESLSIGCVEEFPISCAKLQKMVPEGIETYSEEFDAMGYTVMRRYAGRDDFYVANANVMAPPGSDFPYVESVRVLNRIVRDIAMQASDKIQAEVDPNDLEGSVAKIEAHLNIALEQCERDKVISSGEVTIDTENLNILADETMDVRVVWVPMGTVRRFNLTFAVNNPASGS